MRDSRFPSGSESRMTSPWRPTPYGSAGRKSKPSSTWMTRVLSAERVIFNCSANGVPISSRSPPSCTASPSSPTGTQGHSRKTSPAKERTYFRWECPLHGDTASVREPHPVVDPSLRPTREAQTPRFRGGPLARRWQQLDAEITERGRQTGPWSPPSTPSCSKAPASRPRRCGLLITAGDNRNGSVGRRVCPPMWHGAVAGAGEHDDCGTSQGQGQCLLAARLGSAAEPEASGPQSVYVGGDMGWQRRTQRPMRAYRSSERAWTSRWLAVHLACSWEIRPSSRSASWRC